MLKLKYKVKKCYILINTELMNTTELVILLHFVHVSNDAALPTAKLILLMLSYS